MTDTTLTNDQMIAELEAAGVTIASDERDTSAPWSLYKITASWTVDDDIGMYHITEERYSEPPIDSIYRNVTSIRAMQHAGYTVLMDQTSSMAFRVRVRKERGRGGGLGYNVATTSTSGYPVLAAFEKWEAHQGIRANNDTGVRS